MKQIPILILVAASIAVSTSCNKYLDVEPKGKVILSNVSDYDLFLNGQTLTSSGARELNLLADDVDMPATPLPPTTQENMVYYWATQFTTDEKLPPVFWGKHYSNIYRYNAVLNGIDLAGNGTATDKKRIKAEALLGRAFEYFYLINLYAKPYNATTAAKDLGVPFITTTDISQETPPRSTVADIYKHILDDITAAIPDLPTGNAANRYRGSVPAAYSVLARIYYYMDKMTDAAAAASKALGTMPPALLDYNTIASKSGIPSMALRPFELYARYSTNSSMREYPTIEMLKTFDVNDLRLLYLYGGLGDLSFKKRGDAYFNPNGTPANFGTSVEEMKLIIAEEAALRSDVDAALTQINDIRKCRIKKAVYQPLATTDKDIALGWVLRERKFELAYRGLRWFDMRKLNAAGKMPLLRRMGANDQVLVELPPNSPKYVLQIPVSVLYFNPDMPRNEE
ncbi:MAG: RagB/SusD family nutrient uptake outer membrane protein [Chitinophagaceae bacterium]|nr:RagB/SusD family nutrient uptake outer membrane protein [Chitinophagaceae bacterium]